MQIVKVRGASIEYEVNGEGDGEILLIQGGVISDSFQPLISELLRIRPGLFRIVNFHRRGYSGSSAVSPPFSIEEQAKDCLSLMDELGLKRPNIVGHSMGGLIALQLADDVPERISSLTLIEPSLFTYTPANPLATQGLQKVAALYQTGDKAGAIDQFMRGSSGQDYKSTLDGILPAGWFEQAVKDVDTFFRVEFPSIRQWRFTGADRVKHPTLSIYGTGLRWSNAEASGVEFDKVLHTWLPQTQSVAIQGAYHFVHVTNTPKVTNSLDNFVEKAQAWTA